MGATVGSDTVRNIRQSLHQLAQPLAVLTGLVDLLLLDLDQADPALADVRQISEQLEKVRQIVSDLHRMAREQLSLEPVAPEVWAHPKP